MILVGWSTAAALLIPGIWGALLAVVLGQLQMLVDCCDGEVARWRRTSSPAGVFLDKVGHYTTEALIPLALGIRAAAYPLEFPADFLWTTVGALLALVIVLNKALNDMVHVARANAGLPKLADTHGETAPRGGLVAKLRKAARFLPFHRLYHSVELTLIAFAAAVVGLFLGQPLVDRVVVARCCSRSRSSPCSGTSWRSWPHVVSVPDRAAEARRDVAAPAGRRGRAHDGHPARRPRAGHPQRARPAATSTSTSCASATAGTRRPPTRRCRRA